MGWVRDQIRAKRDQKILPRLAAERLAKLQALRHVERADWSLPTIELVPALSGGQLEAPRHLAPYGEALDGAIGGSLRLVFSAPPQHGKTETTKAAICRWLATAPGKRHAYVTYNQDRAESVAYWVRVMASEAGLVPSGHLDHWHFANRSEVKWTSIGGSLTGQPIDGVLIIDDPFKDADEARSKLSRDRADEWLQKVGMARLHPGASVIVMATRWHEDDLSGRLIKRGWRALNLKAIADGPADESGVVLDDPMGRRLGEALWPSQRPASFLAEARRNAHTWAALYQGEPRPRGGKVFEGEPARYIDLPAGPFRVGYGVDLAYSSATSADWSVCLRGRLVAGKIYLTDCWRKQVDAPSFALTLRAAQSQQRGTMIWHVAGTEKGAAQFIAKKISNFRAVPATSDKYTRAQPAAERWKAGEILIPAEQSPHYGEWVNDFIDELELFSGLKDPHDDQVDALGSLIEALGSGSSKLDPQFDHDLPTFGL